MMETLFSEFFPFILRFIDFLYTPINNLIINNFPDYKIYITTLNEFFYYISTFVNWVLNASFITPLVFDYLISSLIYRVSLQVALFGYKTALKWWDTIVA